MAAPSASVDEVAQQYATQLTDLKMNSKPVINVLTMMAEDYIRQATTVVQTIERHLTRVHPGVKLPVLYLIDSIVKNVKKEYTTLFTQNIVSTFCGVFEKVDEKVKHQMFKLRQTWNEVFPQRKLYAIDVRCHQVDKNWPISAPPPSNTPNIHVNPKFLSAASRPTSVPPVSSGVAVAVTPETADLVQPPVADVAEAQMREKLLLKQKELLELQTKKIELELQQTKAAYETQKLLDKVEKEKETTLKQERLLLQQAEMAKTKTDKAHQLLSTYPNRPQPRSSVVAVPPPQHVPTVPTVVVPAVHDPRLVRQGVTKSSKDHTSSKKKVNVESEKVSRSVSSSQSSVGDDIPTRSSISPHRHSPKRSHKSYDKIRNDKESSNHKSDKEQSPDSPQQLEKMKRRRKTPETEVSKDHHEREKAVLKKNYRKPTSVEIEEEEDNPFLSITPNRQPSRSSVVPVPHPHVSTASTVVAHDPRLVRQGVTKSSKDHTTSKKKVNVESGKVSRSVSSSQSSVGDDISTRSSISPHRISPKRSRKSSDKTRNDKESSNHKSDKGRSRERDSPQQLEKMKRRRKTPEHDVLKDYHEREKAVLKRNYRKTTGVEIEEEENKIPPQTDGGTTDVDLRFHGLKDVDLRTESDGGPEPPSSKKSRSIGNSSIIADLFGREDVDLRQSRSDSWSQMKTSSRSGRGESQEHDEEIRDILQQQNSNRPPPPVSPANSVSSVRSSCDPLGRPRLYNKLPDDPEERKRSLDSRSHSIDPVDQFRVDYIDRALNNKGDLSEMDLKNILGKAHDNLDQGIFTSEQYYSVVKQIKQISEASAMREVQQMQMSGIGSWQGSDPTNPWTGTAEAGPWSIGSFPHRGMPRFGPRGPASSSWGPQRMNMNVRFPPQLPRPSGPNPFEQALLTTPAVVADLIPPVNEMELRVAERDTASSIPIDKVMRQLRFYGDKAVILMGAMSDEPKEILFQKDNRQRSIIINGKPMELMIGEVKRFEVNRKQHTLRIGAPTRELYVDDSHYEICFAGPPIRIHFDNRPHTFQLTGSPPQVEVGKVPRYDLMAGRVTLNVDAVEQIVVYLDEKPQKLDLFAEPVILRFKDDFRTVTLNGRPFSTNFGARLPFSITIPGAGQHFLRFSALTPAAEMAIVQYIRVRQGGVMEVEDSGNENFDYNMGSFRGRGQRGRGRGRGFGMRGRDPFDQDMVPHNDRNHLDMLTHLFPTPRINDVSSDERRSKYESAYDGEFRKDDDSPHQPSSSGGFPDVGNLLELAKKLGLLPSTAPKVESEDPKEEKPNVVVEEEKTEEPSPPEVPAIKPLETVDIALEDNLKEKRDKLISQLWTGVQCSSCGLRFPPDQTVRYSQHLDWHFRFNRREKANYKKAQSRKWYYDLSDWIQFEEVEDLEERAASLFETQEEMEGEAKSPTLGANQEESSVLAQGHEGTTCPQCRETFNSYYDEEQEEWRLKDALIDETEGETKLYHPSCYQDYLKSLVEESVMDVDSECVTDTSEAIPGVEDASPPPAVDKSSEMAVEEEIVVETPVEDEDEVLILKEGKKEVVVMEIDVEEEETMLCELSTDVKDKNGAKVDGSCVVEAESQNEIVLVEKENRNEDVNDKNRENVGTKEQGVSVPFRGFNIVGSISNIYSPIVINDDEDSSSNLLPGISEGSTGGVFGIALNSGILRERSESPVASEEKKIIYKSMQFDIPRIKLEPMDDELPQDEEARDSFLEISTVEEHDKAKSAEASVTPTTSTHPVDIDLTGDDNSVDEVDSHIQHLGQMTAIDGNLQVEEGTPKLFVPPTKIKITMDMGSSGSPKSKPEEPSTSDKTGSVSPPKTDENGPAGSTLPEEPTKGPIGKGSPGSPELKENPELVFTEEMKRLKPRLVGRKLVNYPPKQMGKEESGLCVIC